MGSSHFDTDRVDEADERLQKLWVKMQQNCQVVCKDAKGKEEKGNPTADQLSAIKSLGKNP